MAKFLLSGRESDYDSKKNRGRSINIINEGNGKEFISARRTDGLTLFATLPAGPVRSDLLVNDGFVYVVSAGTLYRVNILGNVETLGAVGGVGRAKLAANAFPGDSQIMVLNGSGAGYIYTNTNGLVKITDFDFNLSSSVTVLNERFWLSKDNSNEFFGSLLSDGNQYNLNSAASAEESPDNVVAVIAKKSALWVLGINTTEYWQTTTDPDLPLRAVRGGSKEWGIIAKDSLAEVNDNFAFLASDRTVRLMRNNQLTKISNLEFELKIKGNGTTAFPGFTTISDAYGFFVDGPIHSIYYITFPTEGYTWGYDINSGLSHTRESETLGYWRANGAVKLNEKIICGDTQSGILWQLDPANKTENGAIMRATLITPTVSYEKNVTIPLIEIDMEVAQNDDPTINPKMIVSYTKDGGNTYTNKGHVDLGNFGDHRKRVPLRSFGRLVRHKDFGIKLEITDAVGVRFYGAHIYPRMGM